MIGSCRIFSINRSGFAIFRELIMLKVLLVSKLATPSRKVVTGEGRGVPSG